MTSVDNVILGHLVAAANGATTDLVDPTGEV